MTQPDPAKIADPVTHDPVPSLARGMFLSCVCQWSWLKIITEMLSSWQLMTLIDLLNASVLALLCVS